MNSKDMDYYEILGVSKDATNKEIREAYLKLVKKYHPDIYKGEDAEEKIKAINIAYDTLSDSKKRSIYDRMYGVNTNKSTTQDKYTNSDNDDFDFDFDFSAYYADVKKIYEYYKRYDLLRYELDDIIYKINNGDIRAIALLDTWLEKANQFRDDYLNSNINSNFIEDLLDLLNNMIQKAKTYQKIDSNVLTSCATKGKYVLDRLTRIKVMITNYPQNKRIIMLNEYAKELVKNYFDEIDFASKSDFDYNHLDFIIHNMVKLQNIKYDCWKLIEENYDKMVKQKEELKNQYNTTLTPITIFSTLAYDILMVELCSDAISQDRLDPLINNLLILIPVSYIVNKKLIKVLFNKIKYHKEIKENKVKIKKLDRFINAYDNNEKRIYKGL